MKAHWSSPAHIGWVGAQLMVQILLVPVLISLSDCIVSSQAICIDTDHSYCKGMH